MRKGVVLKIKKDRAIIMADDCTYCEIKSFYGMYPGMEVCFNEEDMFNKRKLFSVNRYITAACFILLVFCSYLFLSFYQENMATYAYVGIDINPSIEIALNKKGRIINARGLDEEGKEILEEVNVKNMDSMEGVKAIITKSIEMNYLEAENKNKITVYAVLNNKNSEGGKELVEKVEKVIKEEVVAHSIDGEIKTLVSDKKVKKEADKKGISVAKYIMENAKENVAGKNKNNEKNEIITMNTDKNKENKNKDKKDDKKSNELKNTENKKTENKKIDKRDEVNESIKNKKDKLAEDKNNKGNKDKVKEIDRHDNVKNKESGNDKKDKSERKADKDDKNDGEDRKDKKDSEKNRNIEKDKDKEQVKNNKRDKDRDDKKDNKKEGIGDNQKDNKNDDKKDNSRDNNSKVRNDNKDQKMNKYNNKSNNGLVDRLLQKIRN